MREPVCALHGWQGRGQGQGQGHRRGQKSGRGRGLVPPSWGLQAVLRSRFERLFSATLLQGVPLVPCEPGTEAVQVTGRKRRRRDRPGRGPRAQVHHGAQPALAGRGLHSSTSQLNLSHSWSLKPYQARTSQLILRRFLPTEATTTSGKQCPRQAKKWSGVAHEST